MKRPRVLQNGSIRELAEFWATHDSADLEDELEEVTDPIFERDAQTVVVRLSREEAEAARRLAQSAGVGSPSELIRQWVTEKLAAS